MEGYVKKIDLDKKILTLLDSNNGELYIDILDTYPKFEISDKIFIDNDKVFIHMPSTESIIIYNIKKILDCKDLKATSILNKIKERIKENKSANNIERYLSFLNFNDYLVYKHDTKIKGIETKVMIKLLKGWKNRDYRRLNLLGLNNKEIYESNIYPYKLYEMCKKNPFSVPSISLEKAEIINDYYGRITSSKDKIYGDLLRTVYINCIRRGWACFPIDKINIDQNMLNNINDLEYYNLVIRYNYLYYIDNYHIENQVINFLEKKILENNYQYYERISLKEDDKLNIGDNIIKLNDEQIIGIENIFNNSISIITGGPGTGKTTILKKFKEVCERLNKNFIVLGPTGKSVSRIKKVVEYKKKEEEIGEENYVTLDKLIYSGYIKNFDYLLIDEFSMVTTDKFKQLLDCFDAGFNICFIGDNNQLPPIGWGYLSRELVECGKIPVTYLKKNHRCKDDDIVKQCNDFMLMKNEDFKFRESKYFHLHETRDRGYEIISLILLKLKETNIDRDKISIITPFNKDRIITSLIFRKIFMEDENVNKEVMKEYILKQKERYEKLKEKCIDYGVKDAFKVGDRVMNLKNNNLYMIMNGDEGIVKEVNNYYIVVEIDKTNFMFHYSPNYDNRDLDIKDLEYGQSKTVHKAQGDEIDFVIAYLPDGNKGFMNRNLLYTMLTRAKKEMWFVYNKESLFYSIKNDIGEKYDCISKILKNDTL